MCILKTDHRFTCHLFFKSSLQFSRISIIVVSSDSIFVLHCFYLRVYGFLTKHEVKIIYIRWLGIGQGLFLCVYGPGETG